MPLLWSIKAFEVQSVTIVKPGRAEANYALLCGIEQHMLHLPHNASSPNLELPACGWFTWRKMRGTLKEEGVGQGV